MVDHDELAAHLDHLAAWVWGLPSGQQAVGVDPLCAVAIFDFGEVDPLSLCTTEIRGCTESERRRLADRPQTRPGVLWNAAEYDAFELTVIAQLLPDDLDADVARVSKALVRAHGPGDARDMYMVAFESALRRLPWAQRWPLTSDFVVFRWDREYGTRLRDSLRRAAGPDQYDAWARDGVAP